MITKEIFIKYMDHFNTFTIEIEKLSKLINGNNYSIFESTWAMAVENMFDIFLEENFTTKGIDLIYWWMYEDVGKIIYENNVELDCFAKFESEKEIDVEKIDDLWNYMSINKEIYLKK